MKDQLLHDLSRDRPVLAKSPAPLCQTEPPLVLDLSLNMLEHVQYDKIQNCTHTNNIGQ
jgi:hypothetical protein